MGSPGSGEQFDIVHRRLDKRVASFETRQSTRNRIDDDTFLHSVHSAAVQTDADRPGATNLRTDTRFELRRPAGAVTVRVESLLTSFSAGAHAEIRIDGRAVLEEELAQGPSATGRADVARVGRTNRNLMHPTNRGVLPPVGWQLHMPFAARSVRAVHG